MDTLFLRAGTAALLAALAMVSLIAGVLIGLYGKPSARTNAIVMAFGTGALMQAVALELALEGLEHLTGHGFGGVTAWAWISAGFFAGGAVYMAANRQLDAYGASLRHPALTRRYLMQKKRQRSAELLGQLSGVGILRSLPPEEMDDVLMCVQPVLFPAGSVIFQKGDEPDGLYLIVDGRVSIRDGTGASAHTLAELSPGASFGETALLTGERRTAAALSLTDTSLLRIDRDDFLELLDESPRLRHAVESLNSERILRNAAGPEHQTDAQRWRELAMANVQRISRREQEALMAEHGTGSPLALFLGAALDGIPESIVIGATFVSLAGYEYTFLAAIFLSNIPEAVASTAGMVKAGFPVARIFALWTLLVAAGALAAALANVFLTGAPPLALALTGAIAGGGILAMIASVMMPEAYENGGAAVGLATIAGFTLALLFRYLG